VTLDLEDMETINMNPMKKKINKKIQNKKEN